MTTHVSAADADAALVADRRRDRPVSLRVVALLLALAALVAVVIASILVGSRDLDVATVVRVLLDPDAADPGGVIRLSRLPRTAIGLVTGLGLGLAGALIQAVTRNPLADPGILGVTAGSGFAVAIAVSVLGLTRPSQFIWFAFLGALLTTVAVYAVSASSRGSTSPARLVLAGMALSAVLSGIVTAMVLADPRGFNAMRAWEAGSLEGRSWTGFGIIATCIGVGAVLALALGPSLNAVALGDDMAAALGARVGTIRTFAIIAVTLLAGGATALAGPIAFVGLMIPHVARWIAGPDQRWILTLTALLAPILLLASDIVGRIALPLDELPVGIVTAFIGAPVLIALVRRTKVSGL
ncbi:FecCD family ABC transporter permease [Pseudactinotalea sp.]|uniref:FecCD family ABC transporter permease n=1 Tax=Pseudactinotalea sp. TaxID=1926260 RepID=UPI003B3AAE4D